MREVYHLGGITYVISSTEYSKGFYGHWVCDKCGIAGMHPVPSMTPEAAIEQAKLNLLGHHTEVHQSSS